MPVNTNSASVSFSAQAPQLQWNQGNGTLTYKGTVYHVTVKQGENSSQLTAELKAFIQAVIVKQATILSPSQKTEITVSTESLQKCFEDSIVNPSEDQNIHVDYSKKSQTKTESGTLTIFKSEIDRIRERSQQVLNNSLVSRGQAKWPQESSEGWWSTVSHYAYNAACIGSCFALQYLLGRSADRYLALPSPEATMSMNSVPVSTDQTISYPELISNPNIFFAFECLMPMTPQLTNLVVNSLGKMIGCTTPVINKTLSFCSSLFNSTPFLGCRQIKRESDEGDLQADGSRVYREGSVKIEEKPSGVSPSKLVSIDQEKGECSESQDPKLLQFLNSTRSNNLSFFSLIWTNLTNPFGSNLGL